MNKSLYLSRSSPPRRVVETVPVVLIRHAQSLWNQQNLFTGWADPALTEQGEQEARRAAQCLQQHGFVFDVAYSSRLQRAILTRDILLENLHQSSIPQFEDWRLNERHYGILQGVNKREAAERVGEQQVWRWRRGYDDKAFALHESDPEHPRNDPLYADVDPQLLPGVESLADTRQRVVAFWQEQIQPRVERGERVLISAHGNTLRALFMELDRMTIAQVESFEIPTGIPIVYRFEKTGRALDWSYLQPCTRAA